MSGWYQVGRIRLSRRRGDVPRATPEQAAAMRRVMVSDRPPPPVEPELLPIERVAKLAAEVVRRTSEPPPPRRGDE